MKLTARTIANKRKENPSTRLLAAALLALGLAPAWAVESQTMPGMDHGAMQGGSPPPDARDPHAYSDGLVFGPDRQLRLADETSFGMLLVDRLGAGGAPAKNTRRHGLLG